MNLFICRTIFQVYYANIIIKVKSLSDIHFIYLADGFTERERIILDSCNHEYDVVDGNNQFSRLLNQKNMLKKIALLASRNSELDLYFASIDDLFIQTILCKVNVRDIYTFDDGTANYINNSIFYVEKPTSKWIRYKYFYLGNRLTNLNDVKALISTHYSSNNLPNIISNVEIIPLAITVISGEKDTVSDEINVYLCPHFNELYVDPNSIRQVFINALRAGDVIVPHPRDKYEWGKNNKYQLRDDFVAEEIVCELIKNGFHVNLYGIANSTQYHFVNNPYVTNHILYLGNVKSNFTKGLTRQISQFNCLINNKYK